MELGAAPIGYAICGEPRTGSTFLKHVLRSTGILGYPSEFFRDSAEASAVVRDPAPRLDEMRQRASTANGVYGLKVFSQHFDRVAGAAWASRLPNLHFVHLRREDLLGQAVSLARAVQTQNYEAGQSDKAGLRYDRRLIADCLASIAYGQARWECWFARNAIAPLRLVYEELAADPQRSAEAIAAYIGLDVRPQVRLDAVPAEIQRDERSDEWRRRFRHECGDTAYLDAGRLVGRLPRKHAFARFFLGPRGAAKRA